jgi:hypothetical protein
MSGLGQFVAKVSKIKTRSKDEKNYYTYKINLPHRIVKELELKDNDYLFVKSSMKAKWYHLFKWHEEPKAWDMLPLKLQQEIQLSGMNELPSTTSIPSSSTITESPWLVGNSSDLVNVSGLTNLSPQHRKQIYATT